MHTTARGARPASGSRSSSSAALLPPSSSPRLAGALGGVTRPGLGEDLSSGSLGELHRGLGQVLRGAAGLRDEPCRHRPVSPRQREPWSEARCWHRPRPWLRRRQDGEARGLWQEEQSEPWGTAAPPGRGGAAGAPGRGGAWSLGKRHRGGHGAGTGSERARAARGSRRRRAVVQLHIGRGARGSGSTGRQLYRGRGRTGRRRRQRSAGKLDGRSGLADRRTGAGLR